MVQGKYSWLIVAAAFVGHFIFYGVVYGIGVYYVVLEEILPVGPTKVSVLCSAFTAIFFTSGPVSAVAVNKYGCRTVMMIGGAVGSLGFITSSLTNDINVLFVTFAGITGIGLGFCGTPSIVIIGRYFHEKRPLAFGLVLSGVGMGAFSFPAIVRILVSNYGLSGALLINGGLCLHLILCGAIYRPVDDIKQEDAKVDKGGTDSGKDILQLILFKDINFVMLCLNNVLAGFGQSVVFVHLAAYAKSLGFSKNQGAAALSVLGIANWVGRLFFGIIPQVKIVGFFLPFCIGLALSAVMIVSLPFVHSYVSLCAVCGGYGFTWGAFGALQPQTTLYVVGQKYFACAFGYLLVFVATGSIFGAPAAGYLFETTDSYPMSFYIGGAAILGSSIAAILPGYRMSSLLKQGDNLSILKVQNADYTDEKHALRDKEAINA